MHRLIPVLLLLALLACSKSNPYQKFENTKWTGPYGPWQMSVIIDKVEGAHFEGEMHKPAGRITYFEGTFFDNDSLIFTELFHVLGSGLIMNGTYPGHIVGDTLKGLCNFDNVPLPDPSLYRYKLVRDTTFTGKTAEQKIITGAFQKTKALTQAIHSLLPPNTNPSNALNDTTKIKYADLVRERRQIIEKEYTPIQDGKIKKQAQEQLFRDTFTAWRLAKNPADSLWIINAIEAVREGENGYYQMQQMKLQFGRTSQEGYYDFLKTMLDKKLTDDDQIGLLFDLLYASEDNPELDAAFQTRYAALKKEHPDDAKLARVAQIMEKIAVSKKLTAGTKAPDFEVVTLKGEKIKLADFRKKFVFIDFWGSWCGPCRGEIPNIKKLAETIPGNQLQVLGLAKDELPKLTDYIQKENITYPNALADDALLAVYGITGFPTTFLIGPDGKIVAKNLRGENLVTLVQEKMQGK